MHAIGQSRLWLRPNPECQRISYDKRLTEEENEARRRKKVNDWISALSSSNLSWGNRKPFSDLPVWTTPRVLAGGFASDQVPAQLQEDDLPNDYYLTSPGLAELDRLLDSGCYRIGTAGNAALLVVTWLLRNDEAEEATAILQEISPYFDRLRFYPTKAETPLNVPNASLFLTSVGDAKKSIEQLVKNECNTAIPRTRKKISQRRALQDWLPLKYELFALWSETCVDGKPAKEFPDNWNARATVLLNRYRQLETRDQETNRGRIRRGSTHVMIQCICISLTMGTEQLSAWDKRNLESIIAGCAEKYGWLGPTTVASSLRELQSCAPPDKVPQMKHLIDRLAKENREVGLSQHEIDDIATGLPKNLSKYVHRCRMGSLEELVEHGLIASSEVLADLVPALTAQSANNMVPDESLKRLGTATDLAFSRRRSVILFDLQSQVRFEELPWATPLIRYRTRESVSVLTTLKLITEIAIKVWPQTILPNKLVQSMNTLSKAIGIDLPLTQELAADIFMGKFSKNFQKSAHEAAKLMKGTTYETYFGINYEILSQQENPLPSRGCSYLSHNRHAIEQQQIITTHNLAACYVALQLELDGRALALKVWDWILDNHSVQGKNLRRDTYIDQNARQQFGYVGGQIFKVWNSMVGDQSGQGEPKGDDYMDRNARKQVGYAWRQLLFFVSIANNTDGLIEEMRQRSGQKPPWAQRLDDEMFLSPLEMALNGETPEYVMLGCPLPDPAVSSN